MYNKITLLFSFLVCLTFSLNAQDNKTSNNNNMAIVTPTSEIGLMVGLTNYQGDLVEPAIDLGVSNFAFGIYYGKYFSDKLTGKISLLIGGISGDDANYDSRVARGFKLEDGSLTAISLGVDYYIVGENNYRKDKNTAIYVNGGLGFAFFDAKPTGIVEGSEKEENSAFSVMLGGGIKQHLSERFSLGLELSLRPVFSDLLDGISENGNSKNTDNYIWFGLTANYQLGDKSKVRN